MKQLDWFNELQRFESSQLRKGDVIIVDEAGMVGTKDWKAVLDAATKFGAKIIAVGDDNQFKPISAGDCFKHFIERKEEKFELTEIRRQNEAWQRQASYEFSQLNAGTAMAVYEQHGKIHSVLQGIDKTIAEKYLSLEDCGSVVVLCSTKKDCNEINHAIRELKKEKGQLTTDLVEINGKALAREEQIIFTENNAEFDVKNGLTGTVTSFSNGILHVNTLDGEKHIKIDSYSKIDYAYAITLHKAQGKTYDNTIVLANKMMDAKGSYVAMTRHRDSVELFYRESDFRSFKTFISSCSRYANKEALADYEHDVNHSRSRVFEYKELMIESAQVLKDINAGAAEWKEYYRLKQQYVNLGREILCNFDSHKLYLNQNGITKEKLEIQCGLRHRPLSNAEREAKETVEMYAQVSNDTRQLLRQMKGSIYNIAQHGRYQDYVELRIVRNSLAREILSNYPLHREFVSQTSKEFFISKRCMENQVAYEDHNKEKTLADISEFLQTVKTIDRPNVNTQYQKYLGTSIDFVKARISDDSYKLLIELSEKTYGYKQYVSQLMIKHYITEHNLQVKDASYMSKYASLLVQDKINQKQEMTPEIIVDAIKQTVCFEALKTEAKEQNVEMQSERVMNDIHVKAQTLSEALSEKNISILNNKEIVAEALKVIQSSFFSNQEKNNVISVELCADMQKFVEISKDICRSIEL